ncbi:unnamed protein product, partial [Didymodactylos carnosus]
IKLVHEPFSHSIIDDFIIDENNSYLHQLAIELNNIKFNKKDNDLYKFKQSDDLTNITLPAIEKIKQFLYINFKDWLIKATGIQLIDKIDMTCSIYRHTDYLLCHDDDIHGDVEGRRIAFIYYLVPLTWSHQDGGTLDLFDIDENQQPIRIAQSLIPKHNRLTFFEVSDKSYHQVAEVLNEMDTRLSINGWFHGPVHKRPLPYVEIPLKTQKPSEFQQNDLDRIKTCIESMYLDVAIQYDIQSNFQDNSETKLEQFLKKDYYQSLVNDLKRETINWTLRGPYNKRHYEIADISTLPSSINELIQLFGSEPMFTIVASLTGLTSESNENNDDDSEEDRPTSSTSYEPTTKKQKTS